MSWLSTSVRALLFTVLLAGCSSEKGPSNISSEVQQGAFRDTPEKINDASKFLAYQHSITATAEAETIADMHEKITTKCMTDTQYQCVVLQSSIHGAPYFQSQITLRLLPSGVGVYTAMLSNGGVVVSSSTTAEDLSTAIVDGKKRIDMLEKHYLQLEKIHQKGPEKIEDLLMVAKELAKVQADLEYARGQELALAERVKKDLLSISVSSLGENSSGSKIADAFGDFSDDFVYAVADVVTFVAEILPWIPVFALLLWLLRLCWRFLRRKPKGDA